LFTKLENVYNSLHLNADLLAMRNTINQNGSSPLFKFEKVQCKEANIEMAKKENNCSYYTQNNQEKITNSDLDYKIKNNQFKIGIKLLETNDSINHKYSGYSDNEIKIRNRKKEKDSKNNVTSINVIPISQKVLKNTKQKINLKIARTVNK